MPSAEVPVRLVEARCPDLGDAEVDQRQRPQVRARLELICSRGHRGGQQPLRLLRHGRDIPALTCPPHPHRGEKRLRVPAPVRGNRLQRPGREGQVPVGLFQRSPGQLVAGRPGRQLGIRGDHRGRETGEQLVHGTAQPGQAQADPPVGQLAGGQVPSCARPERGAPPRPDTRVRRTTRRRRYAAQAVRPGRSPAVPVAADRRTAGGSGTRTAARPARRRTRPPPRAAAGPARRPSPRSAGRPARH